MSKASDGSSLTPHEAGYAAALTYAATPPGERTRHGRLCPYTHATHAAREWCVGWTQACEDSELNVRPLTVTVPDGR